MGLAPYCIAASILITVAGSGLAVYPRTRACWTSISPAAFRPKWSLTNRRTWPNVRETLEKSGATPERRDGHDVRAGRNRRAAVHHQHVDGGQSVLKDRRSQRVFGNKLAHNTVTFTERR